uniref:synaptic vesicular amine transporter-like n=1 Tax=Ciona intestinalis TaxID=7719 RepID=UPI000180D1E4|nr:synaptic vesicular amine transporter-like [Ciona intestinalis]|eukprot:XP_018667048.1 synaptic vesicular amine transporter-like [Ciona intestinalis]
MTCTSCIEKLKEFTESKVFAVVIVYASLMVDNMLLTAVVPILPEYFYKRHVHEVEAAMKETLTTSKTTFPTTTQVFLNYTTPCSHLPEEKYLAKEPIYIGILFASKPIVQTVTNLAVGPITDRIGFDVPMLVGYLIMTSSALLFAFGQEYGVLLLARAIQGVGSACAATAGMAWLADRYSDNTERGRAIGIALGGLALGVLTGPTFASIIYQLAGKEWVFIILAILSLILVALQLTTRKMKVFRKPLEESGTPIYTLLKDPYILVVAISIAVGNSVIGIVEAGQPIWMIKTMCPTKWELGVAFLPISISYLITINLVAQFGHKVARWIFCLAGFYCCTIGAIAYPFVRIVPEIIGPGIVLGTGVGFVDSLLPVMAFLVDTRHKPVYGSVYAIADISFCMAFILGPLISGGVITLGGFKWLMWGMAIVLFAYAPVVCLLRKVLFKDEETMPILYRAEETRAEESDSVFQ